jgi:hypothetical protein
MNNNNTIEIEVNLETNDFWRYYLSQYFSFSNILFTFLGYTIFGWSIAFLFLRGKLDFLHLIDVIIAAVFFTFLVSFILTYLGVSRAGKIGERKCKYIITNEKVEINAESFRGIFGWQYFNQAKETGKYFVLYMEDGQQLIVPKKFFQEEDLIDFKNLVRTKFGEEAYLKKSKGKLGLR